ncbi:hypothetical protein HZA55_07740 [Candidatus Poribacteria bacterium]|nr:hypothetical protein [Candidatus Poribacteria bacterium]
MSKYLKKLIIISIVLVITFFLNFCIQSINNKFYDLKLRVCGDLRSDPYQIKKKIITISVEDEKTIPQIGYPSPLVHAEMIKKLKAFKVRACNEITVTSRRSDLGQILSLRLSKTAGVAQLR